MNAPHDSTGPGGLREWWASPARSGLRLIISPWEYRRLRLWAGVRTGGAIVAAGLGVITLIFGGNDAKTYGWAALFLAIAAANLAFARWELTIARAEAA